MTSLHWTNTIGIALLALTSSPLAAQVVTPTSIHNSPSTACGGTEAHLACITLPPGSTVDKVDIFMLFDDTGSFSGNVPATIAVFNQIVTDLQTLLPAVDLAFGVGRFEDYGGPGSSFAFESAAGRPFVLNQAIVRTLTANFTTMINQALSNEAPGGGGDGPETALEGLWQVATGLGFDGDGNSSSLDSGPAGAQATQVTPGNSGDVPPFSSHVGVTDGTLGGVGWRAGALHIVILATDIGSVTALDSTLGVPPTVTGTGGSEPTSAFACSSTTPGLDRFGFVSDATSIGGNTVAGAVAPIGAALLPNTITALNALGIRVIGLAPGGAATNSPGPSFSPSVLLSALARLTGAVDALSSPLVFNITGGAAAIATAIVEAVNSTVTLPIDISLAANPVCPGLTVTPAPAVQNGVPPGGSACFNVTFVGDGTFAGCSFDLEFRDVLSNSLLGSIPVTLACPTTSGCTRTQGYWKNHASAWPVASLTLGTVGYTQAELLSILRQPVRGNGLVSLSHQLIAARLNQASGASVPASVATALADADTAIGSLVVPPVGTGSLSTSSVSSLVGELDTYNNGLTAGGPAHCGEAAFSGLALNYIPFANGCQGSLGMPRLGALSVPRIGETFHFEIENLPLDAAFLFTGLSSTMSAVGQLPIDLDPLGFPGCRLHVSPDFVELALGTANTAALALTIPNDPVFAGVLFYHQAFVPDFLAGNPGLAVMAQPSVGVIGN